MKTYVRFFVLIAALMSMNSMLVSQITSSGSGNWSNTGTWAGGVVPTSADSVVIAAGHIVAVDVAGAECGSIAFGDATAQLDMSTASSALNIYGNFHNFSTTHVAFSNWTAGAKVAFRGSALQFIYNLNTSTSTAQTTFMELVVNKTGGMVTTTGNDVKLNIGTSLEVVNGTFQLGSTDDIQGRILNGTSALSPELIVQSGGVFSLAGGASHIRRANNTNTDTKRIGRVTVYGEATFTTTSSNALNFDAIDIESGGEVTINTISTGYFNPDTVYVKSGGTLLMSTTNNVWISTDTAAVDLQTGGVYKVTTSTTNFPSTFINNGTVRYQRSAGDGSQTITDMDYHRLEISFTGNKTWTLGAPRTIADSLETNNSATLVLTAASAQTLNLNGTLRLTSGTLDNSDANVSLILADDATISRATGSITNAPTFGTSVNLRYTSTVTNVTTGPEVPVSASVLKNVDVIGSQGMTLGSDMTATGTVTFAESAGSIITDAYTLTLGTAATVIGEAANRIVSGNLTTTRLVSTGSSTFGGMGIKIEAGTDNLANVTVKRVTGSGGIVTVGSNSGIARTWTITADNPPSGGRDVTFPWVSSDDNGKTFSGTNKAQVYRNDGGEWVPVGALTDVSADDPRSVVVNTTSFSDWTVSDEESPLEIPVAVITLSADDIDMGSVVAGQYRDTVVTIGNTGNDTLKITSIVSDNAMFITSLDSADILPGGTVSDTIRYAPINGGAHAAYIVITSNAGTSPDTIAMSGFGLTYGLSIYPDSLLAGIVTVGQSKDIVISLTNTGSDSVKVFSIISENPVFTVRPSALTIPPGESLGDTIRFSPTEAGDDTGIVIFTSNASSSPDTLKVYGFGATYGLSYSFTAVDFGKVLVNTVKDTILTITNTGNQPAEGTDTQITSVLFTVSRGIGLIAPGASVGDTIRFEPTAAGQVSAKIIFSHTAGGPDTIDVTANAVLTGIGNQIVVPKEYAVSQNYPNPFNPSTTVDYSLPERSMVTISVHNLLGQRIMNVVSSIADAGYHRTKINASNLPSGVYFYTMRAVSEQNSSRVFTMTRKMILTK